MKELIKRQAAIDALNEYFTRIGLLKRKGLNAGEKAIALDTVGALKDLPPADVPDVVYCKDCQKHNKDVGDFEMLPDGKRSWIWKDQACPLVSWRGKAQGHEFDYQYCACAERRTDG